MNIYNKIFSRGLSNNLYSFDSLQVRTSFSYMNLVSDDDIIPTYIYKKDNSSNIEDSYHHRRTARGSITYEEPTSDNGMCPPNINRLPTYYWSLNSSISTSSDEKKKKPKRKTHLLISSSSDSLSSETRHLRFKERKKSSKQVNVAKRKLEYSRGNPFSTISSQTAIADYQTSAGYGILGCDCDFQRFSSHTKQFPSVRTLMILDQIRSKKSDKKMKSRSKSKQNSSCKSTGGAFGILPASSLSNSTLSNSTSPNICYMKSQKSLDEGLMYYQFSNDSSSTVDKNCITKELCTKSSAKDLSNFKHSTSFQPHPLRSICSHQNSLLHQQQL